MVKVQHGERYLLKEEDLVLKCGEAFFVHSRRVMYRSAIKRRPVYMV